MSEVMLARAVDLAWVVSFGVTIFFAGGFLVRTQVGVSSSGPGLDQVSVLDFAAFFLLVISSKENEEGYR